MIELNARGLERCEPLVKQPGDYATSLEVATNGAVVVDCGVNVPGSTEAGLVLADVCTAGLARIGIISPAEADMPWATITVETDQPQAACMASQYAGWQICEGDYFAMGSGPMRAAHGKEKLFDEIGFREQPEQVIGVLETRQLPGPDICQGIAEKCGVAAADLTLLVAPTASLAGICQVVARSLETALHKMHELGIDLGCVRQGMGSAPLVPPGDDDMVALGLSNDAVLYGGDVKIWLEMEDLHIERLGPQIPSSSSSDFGRPFLEIFREYEFDFYKIDPLLFSPARVTLISTLSGREYCFGRLEVEVLESSLSAASRDS